MVVVGVAVAFLFVWQLSQIWIREQSLLDTLIFRVYAPPINGYFVAPAQMESVSYVLNHYAESVPTFFAHKQQTHPPGLFIFYAFFGALFERLPGLSIWFAGPAHTWALDIREWPLLMDHLITTAFATAWVQLIFVSLAPISLYAFLTQLSFKEDNDEWALWSTIALPLIAPLTLFVLQWDTNYPAIGFAACFFAVRGQNRIRNATFHRKGQWFDWLWAGLLLSLLTWLSFGMAVFALLIGIHILWREAVYPGMRVWRAFLQPFARRHWPDAYGRRRTLALVARLPVLGYEFLRAFADWYGLSLQSRHRQSQLSYLGLDESG